MANKINNLKQNCTSYFSSTLINFSPSLFLFCWLRINFYPSLFLCKQMFYHFLFLIYPH